MLILLLNLAGKLLEECSLVLKFGVSGCMCDLFCRFFVLHFGIIMAQRDMCSLEDDDNGLFIMQCDNPNSQMMDVGDSESENSDLKAGVPFIFWSQATAVQ